MDTPKVNEIRTIVCSPINGLPYVSRHRWHDPVNALHGATILDEDTFHLASHIDLRGYFGNSVPEYPGEYAEVNPLGIQELRNLAYKHGLALYYPGHYCDTAKLCDRANPSTVSVSIDMTDPVRGLLATEKAIYKNRRK